MKVNEAPEKIYVCNNVFPNHVDWDGSPINTKRIDNHDIEYTRTDAFIDKIESFLNKKDDRDYYTIGYIKRHLEEIIKEIGL